MDIFLLAVSSALPPCAVVSPETPAWPSPAAAEAMAAWAVAMEVVWAAEWGVWVASPR